MARFRFSLQTLVFASLLAGLAMGGWYWKSQTGTLYVGTYQFTDLDGNACTATVRYRETGGPTARTQDPVLLLHSSSNGGSTDFAIRGEWRFGSSRIRPVDGGLEFFADRDQPQGTRCLLKEGAWSQREFTGSYYKNIHEALQDYNSLAVRLMLSHGADPNQLNGEGKTPLHVAMELRFPAAVSYLVVYGADERIKTPDGFTPAELLTTPAMQKVLSEALAERAARRERERAALEREAFKPHNP